MINHRLAIANTLADVSFARHLELGHEGIDDESCHQVIHQDDTTNVKRQKEKATPFRLGGGFETNLAFFSPKNTFRTKQAHPHHQPDNRMIRDENTEGKRIYMSGETA